MEKIIIIHGDAENYKLQADIMLTDPPFNLPGKKLAKIVDNYMVNHLLLITTMRQLLDFMIETDWVLSFDFVLDSVAPKKSNNMRQPNYTHHTGVYLHKPGFTSCFNRKHRQRSETFEANGYWPTIFHAPKERGNLHGMAKNSTAITDLLGSFEAKSVIDPFAGSGTTGMAAWELGLNCTLIEKDENHVNEAYSLLRFIGAQPERR